jgi:hypothetical protein
MVNLYDIFQSAQGGQAMENLARQYNLSLQQTQKAVEALLPAFSMGLKRQVAEPTQAPNLFAMMGGPSLQAFDNPFAAFTQQATRQGNDALGALFGTKEVSRAVADQAAALSGIGAEVLRAMLPVVATILMGGIAKTAQQQPQLQDIWSQMMSGSLWGLPQPQQPQVQPNPNGGGLLGALLGSLLQQNAQQSQTASPSPSSATPKPKPDAPDAAPLADMIGQMFETGRQIQQSHLDNLEAIFDAFTRTPPKDRA